jgi:glycosyltransferase involved in cell wall biosynthesis
MTKPILLWVGDSPTVHTGFGRVSDNVLRRLADRWDIHVLGMNYSGDPHTFPYPIWPPGYRDVWGMSRFETLAAHIKPDVVLAINDVWVIKDFLALKRPCPMAAYMPIDAMNVHPEGAAALNDLELAIFYTDFGLNEAGSAGFTGNSAVIPHGVDTSVYHPVDRREARATLGLDKKLPADAFIIGNVNRNQPRKRLDLSIEYFAKWVREYSVPENVYLYLHCSQADIGHDLPQLARYWKVDHRLIMPGREVTPSVGLREDAMKWVYGSFDLQISTTAGEGWGLSTHEGMACRIPQLLPDFAALGEWARGAAALVPCDHLIATAGNLNTIAATPARDPFIAALDELYESRGMRERLADEGYRRAREPRFNWDMIADQFHGHLLALAEGKHEKKARAVA